MPDPREMRVVLERPHMDSVSVIKNIASTTGRTFDVYRPSPNADRLVPAVAFIPGDGPEDVIANVKDWGQYVSWGQLIALSGLAAITINHRSTNGFSDLHGAAEDVDAAVAHIRTHGRALGIDAERIALWTCSAGAPFAFRTALRKRPAYLQALVALYSIMDLRGDPPAGMARLPREVVEEFSCVLNVERGGALPPMLVVRAGRDRDFINRSIESFVAAAVARGVDIEYINHAEGEHGFDIRNDGPWSRAIVQRILDFLVSSLTG